MNGFRILILSLIQDFHSFLSTKVSLIFPHFGLQENTIRYKKAFWKAESGICWLIFLRIFNKKILWSVKIKVCAIYFQLVSDWNMRRTFFISTFLFSSSFVFFVFCSLCVWRFRLLWKLSKFNSIWKFV